MSVDSERQYIAERLVSMPAVRTDEEALEVLADTINADYAMDEWTSSDMLVDISFRLAELIDPEVSDRIAHRDRYVRGDDGRYVPRDGYRPDVMA